jgi:hypothetical protein
MNRLLLTVIAVAFLAGIFFLVMFINPGSQSSGLDQAMSITTPDSLAKFVEASSAIVIARYVEATDQPTVTFATALPSGGPADEMPLVHTEFVVDEVLKGDGDVEVNDHVYEGSSARVPVGLSETSEDAASGYPVLWPVDTEFILFLNREEGSTVYYTPWGTCGRVLTDGESVTCSDGDRTVLDFMTGLSREDYIEAIVEEVENPSDTPTPWPSFTPEPTYPLPTATPTPPPTPCAGDLGC